MTPEEMVRLFGSLLYTTTSSGSGGLNRPLGPQQARDDARVPIGRGAHGEPVYEAEVIEIRTEKEKHG